MNLSIETRGPNVLATSGPWINDTNEHTHLIWYIETTGDDTPDFIVKSVLANPGTFTWPSSVVTTAGGSQTCVGTFRNSDGDHTTLEMVLDPQSCFGGIGPLRFSAELAINTGLPTAPDIVTDSAPKPSNTSGAVQPQFSMWVAPRRDPAPYANCAAAKADKATPLHIGDPGYSPQLDADGDGVACEA
ncbi:MAG: excalibur calcium-binding domain-containing protein [Acidimicrobiia bacterium]